MHSLLIKQKSKKIISLTALVDVVFILLFFFMLSSSFNNWTGIDFESPVSSSEVTPKTPQFIRLHEGGGLSIYGQANNFLSDQAIRDAINSNEPVVMLPESDVDVQLIISTLEHLTSLNINNLSLGAVYPSAQ